MKILIVDDSMYCRLATRRFIEAAGFGDCSFAFAGDGAQALQQIDTGDIDVLITDLNMPEMDGQTLLRCIHADPLTRPGYIIVMTSAVSPTLRGVLDLYGVDHVIEKTLTLANVAEAFGNLLEDSQTAVWRCRD